MCGRYTLARATAELVPLFYLTSEPDFELRPSWNIAPTSSVPVLLERLDHGELLRELHLARWGLLPDWAESRAFSARTFNARSETAAEKPSFRSAVRSRRCAVPADAYYEWKAGAPGRTGKRPHAIRPRDGSALLFAGLYQWWQDKQAAAQDGRQSWILSCTILTGPAPQPQSGVLGELADLHDRVPLAMTDSTAQEWIQPGTWDAAEVEAMLQRLRSEVHDVARDWEVYEVDPQVGNTRNNGPELLDPLSTLLT